ncbi:hypothetical protein COCNU_scaffold017292G000010 [Cocos nucifera]|nr:hypothetical protein [Cocos nucifera]
MRRIGNLKGLVADLRTNIDLAKVAMMEAKDKQKEIERVVEEAKEKAAAADKKVAMMETQAQEAALRTLAEYKTSQAYVNDLANGSTIAYRVSLGDYKDIIAWMHPEIDLSRVQPLEAKKDTMADDVEDENIPTPEKDP